MEATSAPPVPLPANDASAIAPTVGPAPRGTTVDPETATPSPPSPVPDQAAADVASKPAAEATGTAAASTDAAVAAAVPLTETRRRAPGPATVGEVPAEAAPIPDAPAPSRSATAGTPERTVRARDLLDTGGGAESPATDPGGAEAAARAYLQRLRRHLDHHKHYPEALRRRGESGTAVVELRIDGDGRLADYGLHRSSGHGALDRAAIAMVLRARPLPALPSTLSGRSLRLRVPVRFRLE